MVKLKIQGFYAEYPSSLHLTNVFNKTQSSFSCNEFVESLNQTP